MCCSDALVPWVDICCVQDAVWVTFAGSLRCTNADEVLLLLKSSDAIAHDLEYAYAQCEDCTPEQAPQTPPQLVLKKWRVWGESTASRRRVAHACAHAPILRFDLKPAGEFRCFVRDGRLLAASQRHCADHFPFLAADMPGLRHQLRAFHRHRVAAAFPQPHCACCVSALCHGCHSDTMLVPAQTHTTCTSPPPAAYAS